MLARHWVMLHSLTYARKDRRCRDISGKEGHYSQDEDVRFVKHCHKGVVIKSEGSAKEYETVNSGDVDFIAHQAQVFILKYFIVFSSEG
jgi:hypothetical protein